MPVCVSPVCVSPVCISLSAPSEWGVDGKPVGGEWSVFCLGELISAVSRV